MGLDQQTTHLTEQIINIGKKLINLSEELLDVIAYCVPFTDDTFAQVTVR